MIPVMQIIHAVKISSRFCYIHHREQLAFKSDVQPVRIVPEVGLKNPNPVISMSNTHRSSAWPAVNVDGGGFPTISEKEEGNCVYLYNLLCLLSIRFKEVPRRSENTWGNKSMLVAAVSFPPSRVNHGHCYNHSNSQPDGGLAPLRMRVMSHRLSQMLLCILTFDLLVCGRRYDCFFRKLLPVSTETLASRRLMLVYMLNDCISKTGA